MAKQKRMAVVCCTGGNRAVRREVDTSGMDCRKAMEVYPEGLLDCAQGCLGLGSCVAACRLDAIHIGSNGTAVVDKERCVGCGLCAKACPKDLIQIVPADTMILPRCSNTLPAKEARTVCSVSCIACRICEKNCPADAISIQENHAVIDLERCISCGMCAVKCPRGVIVDAGGVFTAAQS